MPCTLPACVCCLNFLLVCAVCAVHITCLCVLFLLFSLSACVCYLCCLHYLLVCAVCAVHITCLRVLAVLWQEPGPPHIFLQTGVVHNDIGIPWRSTVIVVQQKSRVVVSWNSVIIHIKTSIYSMISWLILCEHQVYWCFWCQSHYNLGKTGCTK